jgi:hypothetical protein
MTRESMLSTAPFGEALRQAGPRAAAWLEEVGGRGLVDLLGEPGEPEKTFEQATKATPARVEVRLRDGRTLTRFRSIPAGAIGDDLRARHPDVVREKFLGIGGPAEVADLARDLPTASAADVRRMLSLAV